jgi:hypothetical protein
MVSSDRTASLIPVRQSRFALTARRKIHGAVAELDPASVSFVPVGTGIRHFLVDETEVRPVSDRVLHDLRERLVRLPRYAGRDLRLLELTVELRDRMPVGVRDVAATTLPLDDQGRLKSQLLDQLQGSLRRAKPKAAWQPSRAQIEQATALAFGRMKSKRRQIAVLREGNNK